MAASVIPCPSSITDKTVVVDTTSQGERVLLVSDTSNITKSVDSTKDEVLVKGNNVVIQGDRNDSTIQATSISLQMSNPNRPSGTPGANNGNRRGGGNFGGGQGGQNPLGVNNFIGTIDNINADNFTIKTFNNTTYTVKISDSVKYKKTEKGSVSDIKQGSAIIAFGNSDTSGSVTARNISIQ